jgi:hypothetical protein
VFRRLLGLSVFLLGTMAAAHGQAVPALMQGGSIEAGADFSIVKPDYGYNTMYGFTAVGDLNARQWAGFEAEYHYASWNGLSGTTQQSFGLGPRFFYARNRWIPFAKVLVGYGGLTFPNPGNPHHDYGQLTFGGGLDWRWKHNITIQAVNVEYQDWWNFGHPNDYQTRAGSLTPLMISFGVKYRFF